MWKSNLFSFQYLVNSNLDDIPWSYNFIKLLKFINSGYFYSTSSSPLLFRGTHEYSIDPVSELTCWCAIGKYEWTQGSYVTARVGFEPATFHTQGTKPTNKPPRPKVLRYWQVTFACFFIFAGFFEFCHRSLRVRSDRVSTSQLKGFVWCPRVNRFLCQWIWNWCEQLPDWNPKDVTIGLVEGAGHQGRCGCCLQENLPRSKSYKS